MYGIIGAIVQISANTQNINKTKNPLYFYLATMILQWSMQPFYQFINP